MASQRSSESGDRGDSNRTLPPSNSNRQPNLKSTQNRSNLHLHTSHNQSSKFYHGSRKICPQEQSTCPQIQFVKQKTFRPDPDHDASLHLQKGDTPANLGSSAFGETPVGDRNRILHVPAHTKYFDPGTKSTSEKPEASRQQQSSEQGTSRDKQPEQSTDRDAPTQQGGQKRPRTDEETGEGTTDLQSKLIEILDRNSRMVAAQLEAQNVNCRLDREQRKDQANSLVLVLGRLADALGRIADKL